MAHVSTARGIAWFGLCSLMVLAVGVARGGSIDGKWVSDAKDKLGSLTFVFNLAGGALTGTVTAGSLGPASLANGKVDGDKISFEVTREFVGVKVTTKYSGTVSGDTISLRASNLRGSTDFVLRRE